MRKLNLLGATALQSAVAVSALLLAQPAFAQDTTAGDTDPPATLTTEQEIQTGEDDPCATNPNAAGCQAIVVTGSRIRRPNLESVVPITSIAGEQLFERGQSNIGDALNDLPQLRSTFAQQNPGLGVGIAGLNLLDLRGLGTSRTLVLVNSRRHVAADILNNAVSPDVNTIPNDLIERVDIVTGGNSAVYGSDAIAGVVNFVLRRNFDGIQVRGSAAVTGEGFGGNQYISGMVGKNFAGDRANVTVHGEFSNQDRVFGSDIPWFRQQDGFGVVDIDGVFCTGLNAATCDPRVDQHGSDGIPDRVFIRDLRSASINRFGLVPITQRSTGGTPLCGVGIASGAPGVGNVPTAYNCTYIFQPDGTLVPQTGTRFGQGIIGGITGGNGQTGREDQLLSVLPEQQRYNFNLLGHFTVSDAFEPFVEAKWNRVDTLGSNAGPSFIQGQRVQFDARERIRLDNPFLSPADRTTIANAILASGCNTSLTAACATASSPTANLLTAADRAAIAAGTYRFVTARHLADSGIRDEDFRRDTYRVVGGIRGNFNTDWNYEISANYGKFKEDTTTFGYLDRQRFMLSLDAGRNPVTGQIQCRAQFDPAAATAFTPTGADRLAADIAACVPYNPFGAADNSAAAKYFTYNARHKASLSQFDALAFVGGDSSQLFELPGGPVGFVIGGEYRAEVARYKNDDFVESGATNAVVIGEFDPPTFSVSEAFGELRLPLLKDLPFIHDLTVSGAGRVSKYRGIDKEIYTYNIGGEWSPIRDIRFRANYGKAVRAPNVSETGFPAVPNFAPGFADPCASGQIANNPNRAGNCLADLGAALLAGLPNVTYSLPIISGSNPNLQPETSKSLTVGTVIQPRFIPGFSLSADYYNIKVEGVIVSLSAQTIANNCYDQPSLSNVFCGLFERYRGTTPGLMGTLPGQILANSLVSAGVNFARRERRGIDVNANYRTQLSHNVRFNSSLIYVHGLKSSNFENPALPDFENRILSELGDPKDEARLDMDLTVGKFTFGYRGRYIGPMYVGAYEDTNELDSACTAAGCPPNNLDFSDIRKYPAITYHDLRIEANIKGGPATRAFKVYLGVDNIFDKHPPLGTTATGGGSSIYDIRGRNFYAGFKANF